MSRTKENPAANKPFPVKPYRNMAWIRRDPSESVIGRFHIPERAKKSPQRGTVVAVGPGERMKNGKRAPMLVKPGDKVIFGEHSGFDFEVKGETFVVVHEPEILGVVE